MDLEQRITVSKIEELEKRINSLNKKIVANFTNINTLSSDISTLNSDVSDLSNNVADLQENSGGADSGVIETVNFFDTISFSDERKGYNGIRSDRITFLCEKGTLTKIKARVKFTLSGTSEYTATFKALLNEHYTGEGIYSESIVYSTLVEKVIDFEYEFYPEEESNYFSFFISLGTTSITAAQGNLISIKATVIGRNVVIINRRNDFKVYISQNNYYITKNLEGGASYLLAPTANVNLSEPFTPIGNLVPENVTTYNNKYYPFNYAYIPKVVWNGTTQLYTIDSSVNYFLFCINFSGYIIAGSDTPVSGVASLVSWSNKGFIYIPSHPGMKNTNPKAVGFVFSNNNYLPGMSIGSSATTSVGVYIQENGANLSGSWVANCPVFAKNWETNPNQPYMCIATNSLGENYFYDTLAYNYKINLGKGYQTNAYLQPDGTITVYMTWRTKVYKKTLIFNSITSQYELSPNIVEFNDALEILEGYSNDYFINKLGTWEYVPPTVI